MTTQKCNVNFNIFNSLLNEFIDVDDCIKNELMYNLKVAKLSSCGIYFKSKKS
jgi:hypothetical protein